MSFVIINKAAKRGRGRIATKSRVDALARRMDGAVKMDFLRGIESFRRKVDPEDLLRSFLTGNYSKVVRTAPWHKLGDDMEPALARLGKAMLAGAQQTVKALPVPSAFRYSPANAKIESYLRTRTGELITTSEKGMLEAVRAATTRSMTHALTPQQVAREVRGSIGLNAPQARALANYRSGLARDPKVKPERAEALAEGYRARLLDQRATMIGRTEVRFAANAGQQDIWEAAQDRGYLPHDAQRVWVVDGNPCKELCLPMDGIAVGLYEPWTLPDGREVHNPTDSHPNCYCLASIQF